MNMVISLWYCSGCGKVDNSNDDGDDDDDDDNDDGDDDDGDDDDSSGMSRAISSH